MATFAADCFQLSVLYPVLVLPYYEQNLNEDRTSEPYVSGAFDTYNSTFSGITGWDVTNGSVDHVGSLWEADDGSQSVDLVGAGFDGAISQTVSGLIAGGLYRLSWAESGNPGLPQNARSMGITVGSMPTVFNTIDITGNSEADMNWVVRSLEFRAESADVTITFSSGTGDQAKGAALDNVTLAPVPLPAAGLLMLAGLGGIAGLRRRKKA